MQLKCVLGGPSEEADDVLHLVVVAQVFTFSFNSAYMLYVLFCRYVVFHNKKDFKNTNE